MPFRSSRPEAICTPKVLLVPYSKHHVPTYHEWMQDEVSEVRLHFQAESRLLYTQELQKATASEPLTLEEEHAMQRSWRFDADKLTFIACTAPEDLDQSAGTTNVWPGDDAPERMIGDVNLFLLKDEEAEGEEGAPNASSLVIGEVEIMIAKKDLHGNGYGRAVLLAFLWYIFMSLDGILKEYSTRSPKEEVQQAVLRFLRVKIDAENTRSIRLFGSVGFEKLSETPNYFGEIEMRLKVAEDSLEKLKHKLSRRSFVHFEQPKLAVYAMG